jgi:hypothetical protein
MGNKFNFADVRKKAVAKAEKELEQGLEQIAEQRPTPSPSLNGGESMPAAPAEHGTAGDAAATAAATPAPAEPTKGVQTYIPMSQYRRLNDIKLTRRENIADLAAQAINLWLDVQEGKLVVKSPEL